MVQKSKYENMKGLYQIWNIPQIWKQGKGIQRRARKYFRYDKGRNMICRRVMERIAKRCWGTHKRLKNELLSLKKWDTISQSPSLGYSTKVELKGLVGMKTGAGGFEQITKTWDFPACFQNYNHFIWLTVMRKCRFILK